MNDRETIGIVTVLAGVLLVIGAVRGTWSKLFKDVITGAGSSAPAPVGPAPDAAGGPAPGSSGCFSATGASVPCSPGGVNAAPNPSGYAATGAVNWSGLQPPGTTFSSIFSAPAGYAGSSVAVAQ